MFRKNSWWHWFTFHVQISRKSSVEKWAKWCVVLLTKKFAKCSFLPPFCARLAQCQKFAGTRATWPYVSLYNFAPSGSGLAELFWKKLFHMIAVQAFGISKYNITVSVNSPQLYANCSVHWHEIKATTAFKVIQGHQFWYQLKNCIQLSLTILTDILPHIIYKLLWSICQIIG